MSGPRTVRVALLVSPDSFERFYRDTLGLEREDYVARYRNDFVWNYAEALRRHDIDVIAYVPSLAGSGGAVAPDGFAVRFVGLPLVWDHLRVLISRAVTPLERYIGEAINACLLLRSLRRALREDAIDLLYVQEYWTGRFDILVRCAGVPVVTGEHGGSSGRHVQVGKGRSLRRAAAVTVQTRREQQRLHARFGVEARLVTNGVDVEFFAPSDEPARDAVILTVARLSDAQKRISDLIAAVALLPASWRLEIVGTGPDEGPLRVLAENEGVSDRVDFAGWVADREELRARYRSATVFALPSAWEAVTLAVLEAMACGTPAIVTPLPSFLDLIDDGVDGVLVPPTAPHEIAKAARLVAAERHRFSAAARDKVVRRYAREQTMAALAGILRATVARVAGESDAESESSFRISDGNIEPATPPSGALARARALPAARAILQSRSVRRVASARKLAALVDERGAFFANELRRAPGVRRYHVRSSGLAVLLRHGTDDIWTFDELLHLRLYNPPPEVRRLVAARRDPPRILDLGANIGLSGVFFRSEWPDASIVAYEPDPENLVLLRAVVGLAGDGPGWEVRAACAGRHNGRVPFALGRFNESHIATGTAEGTIDVPIEDVLPLLRDVDLLKMDIEGGEWPILADHRFDGPAAVVLEYHPAGCPGPDPHAEAHNLLRRRGYRVTPVFCGPDGVGMVWAVRAP